MVEAPARPLPEHVTVPLLALITQRSLDADYEHVAARRRQATGSDQPPPARLAPRRTAAIVLGVFGLLITVAAVQTSRNAPASDASRESLIRQVNLRRQGLSDLQKELSKVDGKVLGLEAQLSSLAAAQKETQGRVSRLAARTGFGPVRGPGVQITVNSAPGSAGSQLVRDSDLNLLANALWASGAEAISVNGQRLTALGAFRNVGTGVLLNTTPVNPPYVFEVVGNPDTLPASLLSTPAGAKWYALKDSLGFRFEVHNGGTMSLPAAAPQRLRSVKVAPPDGNSRIQTEGSSP